MPVVGLATTEMVTVIRNGESGFIDTDVDSLVKRMKQLLQDRHLASKLGAAGRRVVEERFNIEGSKVVIVRSLADLPEPVGGNYA